MSSGAHRRAGRPALILLQILVFITYIFGPTAVLGEEPSPEPSPTESSAPEVTSDPAQNDAPTIASDKADYAPGELVTLTGANWAAAESIRIFVNDDFGSSWSRTVDVVAGDDGYIVDIFN